MMCTVVAPAVGPRTQKFADARRREKKVVNLEPRSPFHDKVVPDAAGPGCATPLPGRYAATGHEVTSLSVAEEGLDWKRGEVASRTN